MLITLQQQFQSYLLGDSEEIEQYIQSTPVKKRLEIYGDAYFLRLWGLLKTEFPQLLEKLGEEAFEELAFAYLEAYPSRSPSARYIGQQVSRFLIEQHKPALSELAAFEWALSRAIDLPDGPVLTTTALSHIPESVWPTIQFTLHPSVQLLPGKVVWRKGITPHSLNLNANEYWVLEKIAAGYAFEALCAGLSDYLPEDQVAPYLVQTLFRYINECLLSTFIIPGRKTL
ncbi:MAG: putative DNA-binding domain-containing protein [Gammaproteobacteria bacterium]